MSKIIIEFFVIGIGILFISLSFFESDQPYKGQQFREIKALSAEEIDNLLNGDGMGFAKAAELNQYPGPRHLLDDKAEMNLTPQQEEQLETLFIDMQNAAKQLGEELVSKEREIDLLFKSTKADSVVLAKLVSEAGEIRSKIRLVHLETHIKTRPLLSQDQIVRYDELRGYGQESGSSHSHQH